MSLRSKIPSTSLRRKIHQRHGRNADQFYHRLFLKENEFYQSTAQYLDLTSGNRVIQSHIVSLSLYFSVT